MLQLDCALRCSITGPNSHAAPAGADTSICHCCSAFENFLASISNTNIQGTELCRISSARDLILLVPCRVIVMRANYGRPAGMHTSILTECDLPNSGATRPSQADSVPGVDCISLSRPPSLVSVRVSSPHPRLPRNRQLAYLIPMHRHLPVPPASLEDKRAPPPTCTLLRAMRLMFDGDERSRLAPTETASRPGLSRPAPSRRRRCNSHFMGRRARALGLARSTGIRVRHGANASCVTRVRETAVSLRHTHVRVWF